MKKAYSLIGCIVVILVSLCSCTNENADIVSVELLKKVVEVSIDGTSTSTFLSYNGNKLVKIDNTDSSSEFYYTDDLITKIIEKDKNLNQVKTLDFFYTEGKLTKIHSSENYVMNYIYNNDGTVSYEKLIKDSQNKDIREYHGTLTYANENLIKDQMILDNAEKGTLATKTINIIYDDKKNAINNIIGFNKLLNYFGSNSKNNAVIRSEDSYVKRIDTDEITTSIKRYDSKHEYNSRGYSTEIVSESLIFGGNDANHLKSQLFY